MKRIKKAGSLLIALMLIVSASALTACSGGAGGAGGKEEKPETETVRLAVFQHGQDRKSVV